MARDTRDQATASADTTTGVATPQAMVQAVVDGLQDGPTTFTRPGVEERSFTVKDGKISTTREGYDWLLANVAGVRPAE